MDMCGLACSSFSILAEGSWVSGRQSCNHVQEPSTGATATSHPSLQIQVSRSPQRQPSFRLPSVLLSQLDGAFFPLGVDSHSVLL